MSVESWTGVGGVQTRMYEMDEGYLSNTITMILEKARVLRDEVLCDDSISIRQVAETYWPKFKPLVEEFNRRREPEPTPAPGDDF